MTNQKDQPAESLGTQECNGCAEGWPLRERLGELVHLVDDSEWPRAIKCTAKCTAQPTTRTDSAPKDVAPSDRKEAFESWKSRQGFREKPPVCQKAGIAPYPCNSLPKLQGGNWLCDEHYFQEQQAKLAKARTDSACAECNLPDNVIAHHPLVPHATEFKSGSFYHPFVAKIKAGTDSVGAGEPWYDTEAELVARQESPVGAQPKTKWKDCGEGYHRPGPWCVDCRAAGAQPETEERAEYTGIVCTSCAWGKPEQCEKKHSCNDLQAAYEAGRARSVSSPQTPPRLPEEFCPNRWFRWHKNKSSKCSVCEAMVEYGRASHPSSPEPDVQFNEVNGLSNERGFLGVPDKEKRDAGIGSGTRTSDGDQANNHCVSNGGTVDRSVGTREIPAASFGDSMEVAPIQSAPDAEKWLADYWQRTRDGVLLKNTCLDVPLICELLREYASSSNAATEKILADARLIADGEKLWMGVKWVDMRNRALESEAKVVELQQELADYHSADKETQATVRKLEDDYEKLKAERDRLQEALRPINGQCGVCKSAVNSCGHSKWNTYSKRVEGDDTGLSQAVCYECERARAALVDPAKGDAK